MQIYLLTLAGSVTGGELATLFVWFNGPGEALPFALPVWVGCSIPVAYLQSWWRGKCRPYRLEVGLWGVLSPVGAAILILGLIAWAIGILAERLGRVDD